MHYRIKGYRTLMIPSENKWALDLRLEVNYQPGVPHVATDLIEFSTVEELAAVAAILHHSGAATFDPDSKQIVTEDETLSK